MDGESDDVNERCRVYSGAGFKVSSTTSIVQECLRAFPFIWVSVIRVFICGRCLMMLDVAQLLVGEC